MATIKLLGINNGMKTAFDNEYVMEYDPAREGKDPRGFPMICHLVTTPLKSEALDIPISEAFELWRKDHGLRPDGKPNRPLTAFTVEIA